MAEQGFPHWEKKNYIYNIFYHWLSYRYEMDQVKSAAKGNHYYNHDQIDCCYQQR